jgi:hypothetical protein
MASTAQIIASPQYHRPQHIYRGQMQVAGVPMKSRVTARDFVLQCVLPGGIVVYVINVVVCQWRNLSI